MGDKQCQIPKDIFNEDDSLAKTAQYFNTITGSSAIPCQSQLSVDSSHSLTEDSVNNLICVKCDTARTLTFACSDHGTPFTPSRGNRKLKCPPLSVDFSTSTCVNDGELIANRSLFLCDSDYSASAAHTNKIHELDKEGKNNIRTNRNACKTVLNCASEFREKLFTNTISRNDSSIFPCLDTAAVLVDLTNKPDSVHEENFTVTDVSADTSKPACKTDSKMSVKRQKRVERKTFLSVLNKNAKRYWTKKHLNRMKRYPVIPNERPKSSSKNRQRKVHVVRIRNINENKMILNDEGSNCDSELPTTDTSCFSENEQLETGTHFSSENKEYTRASFTDSRKSRQSDIDIHFSSSTRENALAAYSACEHNQLPTSIDCHNEHSETALEQFHSPNTDSATSACHNPEILASGVNQPENKRVTYPDNRKRRNLYSLRPSFQSELHHPLIKDNDWNERNTDVPSTFINHRSECTDHHGIGKWIKSQGSSVVMRHIFTYLSAIDLLQCREVAVHWQKLVDLELKNRQPQIVWHTEYRPGASPRGQVVIWKNIVRFLKSLRIRASNVLLLMTSQAWMEAPDINDAFHTGCSSPHKNIIDILAHHLPPDCVISGGINQYGFTGTGSDTMESVTYEGSENAVTVLVLGQQAGLRLVPAGIHGGQLIPPPMLKSGLSVDSPHRRRANLTASRSHEKDNGFDIWEYLHAPKFHPAFFMCFRPAVQAFCCMEHSFDMRFPQALQCLWVPEQRVEWLIMETKSPISLEQDLLRLENLYTKETSHLHLQGRGILALQLVIFSTTARASHFRFQQLLGACNRLFRKLFPTIPLLAVLAPNCKFPRNDLPMLLSELMKSGKDLQKAHEVFAHGNRSQNTTKNGDDQRLDERIGIVNDQFKREEFDELRLSGETLDESLGRLASNDNDMFQVLAHNENQRYSLLSQENIEYDQLKDGRDSCDLTRDVQNEARAQNNLCYGGNVQVTKPVHAAEDDHRTLFEESPETIGTSFKRYNLRYVEKDDVDMRNNNSKNDETEIVDDENSTETNAISSPRHSNAAILKSDRNDCVGTVTDLLCTEISADQICNDSLESDSIFSGHLSDMESVSSCDDLMDTFSDETSDHDVGMEDYPNDPEADVEDCNWQLPFVYVPDTDWDDDDTMEIGYGDYDDCRFDLITLVIYKSAD